VVVGRCRVLLSVYSGLVLGGVLTLAACDDAAETVTQVEPPSVVVSPVFSKEIRDSAAFVGQIEAVDDITLIARVNGYLEETLVEDGAFVEQGTQLFRIEKAAYEAALSVAKVDLAKVKADTALRRADLERDRDLFAKGHIS
jgi:membrane fusion protein, multidrug efflux system